jgi:hypothetical protein
MVEEFTPSTEERELSNLVADYLRRPNLKALPEGSMSFRVERDRFISWPPARTG